MIPSDILSRVRDQLVESTAAFWTDAELYRYMSDAESEINNMVECNQVSTATTSVTATSGYTLPADCLYMTRVEYNGVPLKLISQRERSALDQPGYGGSLTKGDPTHWFQYANMTYMWPTPATAEVIRYYYVAQPAAIVTASTTFTIPQQFHAVIQDYVLYRAFTKDQDQGKAEWHKREFIQGVLDAKMRENRRRWAGGFPKVHTDRSYSTYNGVV